MPKRKRRPRPPKAQHPHRIERAYARDIIRFVDAAERDVVTKLLPLLEKADKAIAAKRDDSLIVLSFVPLIEDAVQAVEALCPDIRNDADDTDAVPDSIKDAVKRLISVFRKTDTARTRGAREIARKVGEQTNRHNKRQVARQFGALVGTSAFTDDKDIQKILQRGITDNVELIKTVPAQALDQVEDLVTDHFERGARAKPLSAQLMPLIDGSFEKARRRAELIAVDQIGSAVGRLTEQRHKKIGVRHYFWRTAQDERVVGNPSGLYPKGSPKHENHYVRNGKRFAYDKPPSDGHPGRPIRCRCHADPDIDDLF